MIEVIQYEPEHAKDIILRNARGRDEWLANFPEWEKWVIGWKTEGPAVTIVIDGKIVACGGVTLTEWNKGEAWTLFSSLLYKYPKTCFKVSRDTINKIIEDKKLTRVQALASPIHPETQTFLQHLGFGYEGVMRAYGPNEEDMILYSRIRRSDVK
jgi:hypothetical protein